MGGLVLLHFSGRGLRLPAFELLALNAGVVIGLALLALVILRSASFGHVRVPDSLVTVVSDFRAGVASLNRRSVVVAVILSAGIWLFEVAALIQTFSALDLALTPPQALLVMGAASLSTLVPTAPGYLGTYQLVFVLAMRAFGLSDSAGIVCATAIQVCLFGSVTMAGALILTLRSIRHLFGWSRPRASSIELSAGDGAKGR